MNLQQAIEILTRERGSLKAEEPADCTEARELAFVLLEYARQWNPEWSAPRLLLWLKGYGIETVTDMLDHAERSLSN